MKQISRKLSRRILFQKLYAQCFYDNDSESFFHIFVKGGNYQNEIDTAYVEEMYDLIQKNERKLISIIHLYAPKFDIEKMHISYILPLFIGLTEMFFLKEEIPSKVSMNEAIELSKIFSDDSGKKIVNGVLNKALENFESIKNTPSDWENLDFSFFVKD